METRPRTCGHCGAPCPPTARFCGGCGAPLPPPETATGAGYGPAAGPPSGPAYSSAPQAYPSQQEHTRQGYPPPQAYPPQQGYAAQRGYPPPQAYPPQQGYAGQRGYPPPQAYPPQQGVGGQQPTYPPPGHAYPQQVYAQPPAYGPPRGPAAYPAGPQAAYGAPRRRRRSGCMWGCLGIVLVLFLAAAGVVTWRVLFPPRSDNMQLGERVSLLTASVAPSGDRLTVEGTGVLNGLAIDVPAGAYEGTTRFRVSARPIEGHRFGPDLNPITPLIQVDNGHGFAAEPIRVEIPIALQPGQFAMAFFYDETAGTLEGLPTAELAGDRIAVLTSHFSSLFVSIIDMAMLEAMGNVDTGFQPGVDDWQFPNHGSIVSPGGHCAGQSITAMWYYDQQRLAASKPALYGLYDNNARAQGTPQLWQDDSWGYRFASSAHKAVDWSNQSAKVTRSLGSYDDRLTLYSFVYAMHLTGEPQYVSIGRYAPDSQDPTKTRRSGHALVAYKFEDGKLHVADPNYPGQDGRVIPFADGRFKPYASGASVAEIEAAGPKDYTEIRYLAKSALIDWGKIDTLYKAMLKGKAGAGLFPAYTLAIATGRDEQGELIWSTFPDVLQLDEDQTAQIGEAYRGQALLKLEVPSGVAHRVVLYDDTSEIERADVFQAESTYLVPLELGNNEIGVYTQLADDNSQAQYNDFWRVKIAYGRIDLTGTWEGTFQVEDMGVIRRWIEEVVVRVLLATGLSESESEARATVSEIVVEDASVYQERPVTLTLDPPSALTPNRYPARAVYSDDAGKIEESSGEAVYEDGELHVRLKHADRSVLRYTGTLAGAESSYGTFSIDAWGGIVRNALSGSWRMSRVGTQVP